MKYYGKIWKYTHRVILPVGYIFFRFCVPRGTIKNGFFEKRTFVWWGGGLSFSERLFGVRGHGHNRFDTQKNRLSYDNLHTYNLLTKIIKKTFIIIKTNGLTIFHINTIISTTKLITISRAYNINI